jgi:hypothetical protein
MDIKYSVQCSRVVTTLASDELVSSMPIYVIGLFVYIFLQALNHSSDTVKEWLADYS